MKNTFQNIGAILLISLLLIKVSAFHMYEHAEPVDDTNEHCELCVLTIEGQQLEGTIPSIEIVRVLPPIICTTPKINFSRVNYKSNDELSLILARPPPLHIS